MTELHLFEVDRFQTVNSVKILVKFTEGSKTKSPTNSVGHVTLKKVISYSHK